MSSKPASIVPASPSLYLGHATLDVDLQQRSFGARPSLLPTGLLYPRCETVELDLRVNFWFSPTFCFLFPLGHARYDITVARGQQSQYRHQLASKARSTRYLLHIAYTPCVACTVHYVLMCACTLRASTFTSNLVVRFIFTYEISTA